MCLSNFTKITATKIKCDSLLLVNGFFISEDDFDLLLYDHSVGNKNVADSIINITSGYASIECRGYISPFDVLWMNWKREIENKKIFYTIRNGALKSFTLIKTASEIYYSSPKKGEQSFILPSQMIKELTDIKKGDGKYFYNLSGELIAFSSNARADIDMQEQLYIKKEYFENALKKSGMIELTTSKIVKKNALSRNYW